MDDLGKHGSSRSIRWIPTWITYSSLCFRYGYRRFKSWRAGAANRRALVPYCGNHDDLAGYYDEVLITVEEPDYILRGYGGALVAVRSLGRRKFLAVIYKELTRNDSFIITAYFATQISRRAILWRKETQ